MLVKYSIDTLESGNTSHSVTLVPRLGYSVNLLCNIVEILEDFQEKDQTRNISITLISERGVVENPESFIEFFTLRPKKVS